MSSVSGPSSESVPSHGALEVRLELDAGRQPGHRVVQDLGDAQAVAAEHAREPEQPRERRLQRAHDGRRGRQRERGRRAIRAQAEPELGPVRVLAGGGAPAAPVGHALRRAREDADEATVRRPARHLDAVRSPAAQARRARRRTGGESLRVGEVRELRQGTGTVETVMAQCRAARSPGNVHGDGACAEQRRQSPDVQADQVCGSQCSLRLRRGSEARITEAQAPLLWRVCRKCRIVVENIRFLERISRPGARRRPGARFSRGAGR